MMLCPGGRRLSDTVPCGYSTFRQSCICFITLYTELYLVFRSLSIWNKLMIKQESKGKKRIVTILEKGYEGNTESIV